MIYLTSRKIIDNKKRRLKALGHDLFIGVVAALFATWLYTSFIQPQQQLYVTTDQIFGSNNIVNHAVFICIHNNGTTPGYIHLFIGAQDSYQIYMNSMRTGVGHKSF